MSFTDGVKNVPRLPNDGSDLIGVPPYNNRSFTFVQDDALTFYTRIIS